MKTNQKIDAIIPAYNEQGRIGEIIKVLQGTDQIARVIVVDDGSEDNTYFEAKRLNVNKIISHSKNKGKGAALESGIKHIKTDPFLITDADLKNFTPDHIKKLISEYEKESAVLVNGVLDRGELNKITKSIEGLITGVRLVDKKVWEKVKEEKLKSGYEIDYLIYEKAKKNGNLETIALEGLDQYKKMEKLGFWEGLYRHIKMFVEIIYKTVKRKLTFRK